MLKNYYISSRFFSEKELKDFRTKFGNELTEISYSSNNEIDFNNSKEKSFLLENGYPMILARFFA